MERGSGDVRTWPRGVQVVAGLGLSACLWGVAAPGAPAAAAGQVVTIGDEQVTFSTTSSSGAVGSVNGYEADTFDLESGQAGNDFFGGADLTLGTDSSGQTTLAGNLAVVPSSETLAAAPTAATAPATAGETLLVVDHAGHDALVTIQNASAQTVTFSYELQSAVTTAQPQPAGQQTTQPTTPATPSQPAASGTPGGQGSSAAQGTAGVVTLRIGDTAATVNGKSATLDVPAQLMDGSTMVPFRFLGEALGARVGWNQAAHTAIYQMGSTRVLVVVGAPTAQVDGRPVTLAVPAAVVQERTLVPLRFVSEALGAQVGWDQATETVTVTMPSPGQGG